MKIIFDYNRTIFNPETDSLYQGTIELLEDLNRTNELFLISKNEPGRDDNFQKLGIKKYFKQTLFVVEKDTDLFKKITQNEKAIVVGDRIRGEISIGNQLGYITIWVQQGKFAIELPDKEYPAPNHIVKNITEIRKIISIYEK